MKYAVSRYENASRTGLRILCFVTTKTANKYESTNKLIAENAAYVQGMMGWLRVNTM